jgi:hypothetical protein
VRDDDAVLGGGQSEHIAIAHSLELCRMQTGSAPRDAATRNGQPLGRIVQPYSGGRE